MRGDLMSNKLKWFVFTAVLVVAGAMTGSRAQAAPNSTLEFLQGCAAGPDCERRLFLELSKTYRPSREEAQLRDYVLAIKAQSEAAIWKRPLETAIDAAGNVLIRLPATGAHATRASSKPFAVQSHMDMVLAYADAKPGEDIRPYFRNGVDVEEKDGWLRARDSRTTLGADNGIGVAIGLRYLIDPFIDHPPLELIFTVEEETGLTGAMKSQLPLKSRRMLCLDGMTPEEGQVITGSQGESTNRFELEVPATEALAPGKWTMLRLSVRNLAGGHSGTDIYRNRLNALKALGSMLTRIKDLAGSARLKSAVVGDPGIYNKIPNLLEAQIAAPATFAKPAKLAKARDALAALIKANANDAAYATFALEIAATDAGSDSAASGEFTDSLAGAIAAAPNGVIDFDPKFTNGVFTSNNLSFMTFAANPAKSFALVLGDLARGFEFPRVAQTAEAVEASFAKVAPASAPLKRISLDQYPPWLEPATSGLLRQVLGDSGYFKAEYRVNGGLEPSAFKRLFPGLEVVALGPHILEAHTVHERMSVDSIPRAIAGVRAIVQSQE